MGNSATGSFIRWTDATGASGVVLRGGHPTADFLTGGTNINPKWPTVYSQWTCPAEADHSLTREDIMGPHTD